MTKAEDAKSPDAASGGDGGDGDSKLIFANAILIAIITVIAALVAWRASVSDDATGDADYDGLKAVVSAEEVRTLGTVEALTHAQAYANYRRYDETVAAIDYDLESATGKEAADLQRKRREADVLVDAKLRMFPNKYLQRTGKDGESSYDAKREVGQFVSNQARSRDLISDDDFKSAEAYRSKTNKLLFGVLILTVSLVFLTLVEAFEGPIQLASFGIGLLLGLGGIAYSIAMEVAKYE